GDNVAWVNAAGDGPHATHVLCVDARGNVADIEWREELEFCHVSWRIRQLDASLPIHRSLIRVCELPGGSVAPIDPQPEVDAFRLDRIGVHEDQLVIVCRVDTPVDQRAQAVSESGGRDL